MKQYKKIFFALLILVFAVVVTGISYADDKGNSALYFPGSQVSNDDYTYWYNLISLSDPRLYPLGFDFKNTSITIEAWIKPEKIPGVILAAGNLSARVTSDGFVLYLWKGASPNAPEGCHDNADYNCVKFAVKSNGAWYAATAYTPSDLTNGWHHVAGVLDISSGTITVYVDGNPLEGADNNHPNHKTGVSAMADSGSLFIGANQCITPEETIGGKDKSETHPGIKHWFKGTVDEIRLWKEARTQSLIKECMNQELKGEGSCKITAALATYLKFNEGGGSTVRDSSVNGNNGSFRYYKNAKKVKKDHNVRVGYHTQVQDPESLEIQDQANWIAGYPFSK
ncbi:MAG: LamG domain-containing protein [Nitrospirae bacterium]|nr:LamG domain-containing protein [Nitrospirota bacterium]